MNDALTLSLQPALAEARKRMAEGMATLRAEYEARPHTATVLKGRAALVDREIARLWSTCQMPAAAAVVAVGGYGRGELFPASDVDLLILLPEPPDAAMQARLSTLVGGLWDMGLEIGHSVRTVDECMIAAADDITVQTSLLEARLLTGNAALFGELLSRYRDTLDVRAFYKAKVLEQEQRYARFNETPYALEPNCKESPGGLRDLQMLGWIARAAGLGLSWRDLARRRLITASEASELRNVERFLQHLRIRLHYLTGRAEDRLLFDHQEKIARVLDIESTATRRASEVLEAGEIYGFVASDYGRLEVGLQDGPADTLAFAAPLVALGQVRGEFSRYAGTQALLRALDTQDAFKVIYLSPPVGGLRGGVSYSPKVRRNAAAVDSRDRIEVDNAFELGLQYQQPVGDWILGASGGYATGEADPITTRADLNSWSVGAEARRGPLRIGAAYVDRGDSNRLDRGFDQWEVNGGVGWVTQGWGVAGSVALTRASDRENRLIGVGGYYQLHPNIQIRADVVSFREERFLIATDSGIASVVEIQFTI